MVGAHRISWEVMEGPIPAGLFVCHDCDVRSCVNPDHLFLGTAADNAEDMAQKGRGTSKLDRTEREQVVQLRDQGLSMRAIAQAFGCSPTHICNVLGRRGQGAPRLQSSQRESIRLRHGAGETQAALAAEFGVTPSAVSRIVKQEAI